jgi:dTDP-4-dehydrorhamnose reductase
VRADGVFIVGARGLIGTSLAEKAAKTGTKWIGTTAKAEAVTGPIVHLDLLNDGAMESLSISPAVSYLCAAETNIRKCEDDPGKTRQLNVDQTVKIARRLHEAGSDLVYLSSNLVFDGNLPFVPAEAECAPVTEYGRQKAEVESILLGELERLAVVRLTKVVHHRFPLFLDWLKTWRDGQVIRPFSDMFFSPVELAWVTDELWALNHSFARGIFQLSGDADISYAQAARALAKNRKIDQGRVVPQTMAEAGYQHISPKNTTLAYQGVRTELKPDSAGIVLERIFRSIA